jgi:hypothetical protein
VPWVPDGVIKGGEYTGHNSYSDIDIYWRVEDPCIYIGLVARTSGWIAIGFGPETLMKNADIIQGMIVDGKLVISDQFSTGGFGPHPPDTELGGTDDILESGGKLEGGTTVIEFKRKLVTGDKYDKPLVKGKNTVLWAIGGNDPDKKHTKRGFGELDIP